MRFPSLICSILLVVTSERRGSAEDAVFTDVWSAPPQPLWHHHCSWVCVWIELLPLMDTSTIFTCITSENLHISFLFFSQQLHESLRSCIHTDVLCVSYHLCLASMLTWACVASQHVDVDTILQKFDPGWSWRFRWGWKESFWPVCHYYSIWSNSCCCFFLRA